MSVSYECDECGKDRHADDGIICPDCFEQLKADRDDLKGTVDKAEEEIDELADYISRLEKAIEEHAGKDVLDAVKGG